MTPDPYDKLRDDTRKMLFETDGRLQSLPARKRLARKMRDLEQIVERTLLARPKRLRHSDEVRWRDVSRSKSLKVADFVRKHPPARPVKIGFAALALGSVIGGLIWRRFKR